VTFGYDLSLEVLIDRFRFSKFAADNNAVHCHVEFVGGTQEGMDGAKQKEVEALLGSMGKWESLMNFLDDSGLGDHAPPRSHFGRQLYEITSELVPGGGTTILMVYFGLTKKESLLRKDNVAELPVDEVAKQVENIDKWRNFEMLGRSVIGTFALVKP
jgi:hypothetical protein